MALGPSSPTPPRALGPSLCTHGFSLPSGKRQSPFAPVFLDEKGHFGARVPVDEGKGVISPAPWRPPLGLRACDPRKVRVWDQLQYGSSLRGPWPTVRASSSGPRPGVTCPEPPWKPPHPSHLPPPPHPRRPSSSPGPATHPPERAGAASPVRSPRLTPSTGARGSLAGQSLEAATRRRAGDSRAAAGSEARLTAPAAAPPPPPLPRAAQRGPVLRPKAGPP